MTLSASAIINGLTMLRAYKPDMTVWTHGSGIYASFSRDLFDGMHPDDKARMTAEGWVYWNDPESDEWRLLP